MKQYITKNQWDELSDKNKEELNKYFNNKNMTSFVELTIGQMIDFLFEKEWGGFSWEDSSAQLTISTNLTDNLWEAVKSVMRNKQ